MSRCVRGLRLGGERFVSRFRRLGFCAMFCATGVALTVASPASAGHGAPEHWNKNGASRVSLYFDDNTGSAWPVGSNITRWNEAYNRGADVFGYYRTSCSGATCVTVNEYTDATPGGAAGCVGDRGCFLFNYFTASNHITSRPRITSRAGPEEFF